MAKSKNNTYYKDSGKKVTVPSRTVNSKQTRKSEATLGRAQDTGKGRGPLRGVARRSREGMEFLSDAAMKKKYPSQNVSGARGRARTEGKVVNGVLIPAKTVPVKRKGPKLPKAGMAGFLGGGGFFEQIK